MSRARRRRIVGGVGAFVGLCVSGAGCQTASGMKPSLSLPAPPPAVAPQAKKEDKTESRWGSFTSLFAGKPKEPTAKTPATTVGWRPAARPDDTSPTVVMPTGSPQSAPAGISLAGAVEIEPPRSEAGAWEPPPPQLLTSPPAVSPAPREVSHTIIGPVAGHTPRELFKRAMPAYRVEPPDILLIDVVGSKPANGARDGKAEAKKEKEDKPEEKKDRSAVVPDPLKGEQAIRGPHLVRPDGTVGLGVYGSVFVGGLTLEEIRHTVAAYLTDTFTPVDVRDVSVDVISYNSKFYYVVVDGGGYGEQVVALPFQGSETVLDAIAKIGGLPAVSDKTKVWVARRGPGDKGQLLHVDWIGITQHGGTVTNHQIIPGDRIYVKADCWQKFSNELGKRLNPIEQLFGGALLGSETVNSIRGTGR